MSSTPSASPVSPPPVDAAPRIAGPLTAWAAWDWGSAAFNHIVTTFVFTVYLTNSVAPGGVTDPAAKEAAIASGSSWLAAAISIAGVIVALVAPVWGQRSDAAGAESGRQRRLGLLTGLIVLATAAMFFVAPSPGYLPIGLALLGIGTIAYEVAQVEYNAMIYRLAPPGRTGWVSGLGWSAGYVGGIVLLVAGLVLFLADEPVFSFAEPGMGIRTLMLVAAAWFAVFAVPVLFTRFPYPPPPGDAEAARTSWWGSYVLLVRRLVSLWRTDRNLLRFLISSAIFRDGLTGAFTFGGVLAAGTFGLSQGQVLVFAVAANVVSALGALVGGKLDDRFGPKNIIVVSLAALVVVAVALLLASGQTAFWVIGMFLSLFLGPAQACARSYLARLVPPGREGEIFGLYATTGKAASFLAPALFALFIAIFGEQRWGIAGLGIVLLVGLLTLLPVRSVSGATAAGAGASEPEPVDS